MVVHRGGHEHARAPAEAGLHEDAVGLVGVSSPKFMNAPVRHGEFPDRRCVRCVCGVDVFAACFRNDSAAAAAVSRRPSTVSWTSIDFVITSKKKSTSQNILSRISST